MSEDANTRLQRALELDETLATQRVNLARAVNSDVFARVGQVLRIYFIILCSTLTRIAPQVHNTTREVDYELEAYMRATASAKRFSERPGGGVVLPGVDGLPPRNARLGALAHGVADLHDRVVGESLVGGSHRIHTPLPRGGVLEGINPRLWPRYQRHRLRHRQTADRFGARKQWADDENADPQQPLGGGNARHNTAKPATTTQTSAPGTLADASTPRRHRHHHHHQQVKRKHSRLTWLSTTRQMRTRRRNANESGTHLRRLVANANVT